MHDLVLRGGLVVTPYGELLGGVAIDGERITVVGADPELGDGHQVVDLDGKVVLPGLIDPHVHFGIGDEDTDDSMREDFRHDSRDCLIGGVTTICTTTLIEGSSGACWPDISAVAPIVCAPGSIAMPAACPSRVAQCPLTDTNSCL